MEKNVQWSLAGAAWVLVIGLLALGWTAVHKFGAPEARGLGTPERPLCPVDRVELTLAADTPHADYMGRDYYFCSRRDDRGRDHKTLFLMDPELYLSGVSSLTGLSPSAQSR